MPRPHYTNEQKKEALQLCAEIGITKASKRLEIAYGTLNKWRKAAQNGSPVEAATDDTPVEEVTIYAQTDGGDISSTAIAARLGKNHDEAAVTEDKVHPESEDRGREATDDDHDDLIRLRTENAALKTQMATLKNALRAFTE
jgi:transposase-like protein